MMLVRRIGYTLIAVAAVAVWFLMAPEDLTADAREDRVADIQANDDANNAMTEGAPQQAVVNGWTTIEYLDLISEQVNNVDDDRPAALLTLLVLATCLQFGTNPGPGVLIQRAVPRLPVATPSESSVATDSAHPGTTP